MVEKQASSEIAQSRERFEERADKAGLSLDWDDGYEDIETDAAWRGYQWAERDTRERVAQIAREYLKLWPTMAAELAERIRGKE